MRNAFIYSYSLSNDFSKYAQLGYNKDDVSTLSSDEVEYLKDIEGELIGADVKYMEFDKDGVATEISKNEYDQHKNNLILAQRSLCQISTSGCSDTETTSNWMRLTTTISKINNTSPQEYLIKHEFNWVKKPTYTYTDAVGVAQHASLSPVQNSELLTYNTDHLNKHYYWSRTLEF